MKRRINTRFILATLMLQATVLQAMIDFKSGNTSAGFRFVAFAIFALVYMAIVYGDKES